MVKPVFRNPLEIENSQQGVSVCFGGKADVGGERDENIGNHHYMVTV